ncbi:hypothetical protein [Streptomyces abyssomicinicus]|uniref:hypothetical protein n=1 Tax=Streptomyces abyssomicinicus TaxID=574929 RepID=UPI00124FB3AA|nr:hypothetical protein [Streptomyces abyssomicinicus]
MSEGLALFAPELVAPGLEFVPPPPPPELDELAHAGGVHVEGMAEEAAAQLGELAGQAADAALQMLGSLSGALLAARAAMATTQVLATAAVRAAEHQRCLERQQKLSAQAAEQWRDAAFAAARANARRTALRARVARAARRSPGDPPPGPDLPGPLAPAATRLCDFRRELAAFEARLKACEDAQAVWESRSFADFLAAADPSPDWQDAVRARREAITGAATAPEAARTVPDAPQPSDPTSVPLVRERGADILAALDPQADAGDVELATDAVRHAVRQAAGNPRRARTHLREARLFVERANRTATEARAAVERAAVRLDFLTTELPPDDDLPEPDPAAVAALHRCVADGTPLSRQEQTLVDRVVREHGAALEAFALKRRCTDVLARLAVDTHGEVRVGAVEQEALVLDWTPGGWGPGHWLRMEVRGDSVQVTTMRTASRGERGAAALDLDARRCAEASERMEEFSELARASGLPLKFDMRAGGVLAGEPVAPPVRAERQPEARKARTAPAADRAG